MTKRRHYGFWTMKIEYNEQFLKDMKKLRHTAVYSFLKTLCFEELPVCENLSKIGNIKKIQGYKSYYRIKAGDYRIGIKDEGGTVVLMRVLHRKDIYRVFPPSKQKNL